MRLTACRSICLGWLAAASPVHAEEPDDDSKAAQMIEEERRHFGIGRPQAATESDGSVVASGNEIVVRARRSPPPRLEPLDGDTPALPPDMKTVALGHSPVPHLGGGVTIRGCFLQKCPRDLYFIDLSALPEPPPDSDADKMSRGEKRVR